MGEVLEPPEVGNDAGEVEGRASDKLKTAMGAMGVGKEAMEEVDEVEAG